MERGHLATCVDRSSAYVFIVYMISNLRSFRIDSSVEYIVHLRALFEASSSSLKSAWLSTKVSIDDTSMVMSYLIMIRTANRLTYACQHGQPCVKVRQAIVEIKKVRNIHHCTILVLTALLAKNALVNATVVGLTAMLSIVEAVLNAQ